MYYPSADYANYFNTDIQNKYAKNQARKLVNQQEHNTIGIYL